MNFDWRNIDLKNASIFDLTDDLELIRSAVDDECFTMEDKDAYLKNLNDMERFLSLNDFSVGIDDIELEQAVDKAFPEELKKCNAMRDE